MPLVQVWGLNQAPPAWTVSAMRFTPVIPPHRGRVGLVDVQAAQPGHLPENRASAGSSPPRRCGRSCIA